MDDISNKLNTALNIIDETIDVINDSIPSKTSQLTNDSDFVTSGYVDDALSGKQDIIDSDNWIPANAVRMDIDHWQGDPDFDVESAVNMTRDDVYAVSGVVSGLLSSKQDAITNDNKLDYGLLSGTPSIPLSTSELVNDSDFATSGYVDASVSGKLDISGYVAPYKLPFTKIYSPGGTWFQEDIGVTMEWSDTDIIPNSKKIDVISFVAGSSDDHLVFPSLYSASTVNEIVTCELWVKMAGNTSAAQGIAGIVVPSSYFVVDEDNFPTSLKGEATNNEAYTYHVFVIRAVPRQGSGTSLCEVAYSHVVNSNISL